LFTLADEHGGSSRRLAGSSQASTPAAAGSGPLTETGSVVSDVVREQRGLAAASHGGAAAVRAARRSALSSRGDTGRPPATPGRTPVVPAARIKARQPTAGAPGKQGPLRDARDEGAAADGDGDDDAQVLRDLFEGTGVRSLMDHTRIGLPMMQKPPRQKKWQPGWRPAAAEVLRQSRQACQGAAVHVPTWTGRHGSAGAPGTARSGQQQQQQQPPPRRTGSASSMAYSPVAPPQHAAAGGSRVRFGRVRNPLLLAAPPLSAGASDVEDGPTRAGGDAEGGTTAAGGAGAAGKLEAGGKFGPEEEWAGHSTQMLRTLGASSGSSGGVCAQQCGIACSDSAASSSSSSSSSSRAGR